MSDIPDVVFNYFPKMPEPVTEGDFVAEMAREALKDLLILGYHMAPNGDEWVMVHD